MKSKIKMQKLKLQCKIQKARSKEPKDKNILISDF